MARIGKGVEAAALKRRAVQLARPGMEALLLAAVALGCAQFGASVLQTNSAHSAPGPAPNDDGAAPRAEADVRTPFAPNDDEGFASNASAALLSSVKLAGVRMADDAEQSGAILTLENGAQRAFAIGDEIAPGLRLAEVRPDFVQINFDGGARRLDLEAAPQRFSFARALLGEAQDAPPPPEVVITPPQQAQVSDAESAWLASTLAHVETQSGAPRGWRIVGPVPAAYESAGVREGDLVLTVNGIGPDRLMEALGAAASGRVELSIERAGAPVLLTLAANGRA